MTRRARPHAFFWLAIPLTIIAGCPTTPDKTIDTANNSSIDTAVVLEFVDGAATLTSSRLTAADVDFFELGALATGDRVIVDVQTASGNLDAVAAIFDADLNLFALNDDRTPDSNLNPLIDAVVREPGTYYVAVSAFAGTATSGTYKLTVTLLANSGQAEPKGQIVYLDWNGGAGITIPNVGTFDLPPFDAAQVGLDSTQTDALKTLVEAIVIDSFAGFDILFRSSDRDERPSTPHSTVFFGGFNRQAFAISEQVDSLNADPADDAIIFTESFNGAFSERPGLDGMALALGNTTAHEIGHLLGLVHTAQATDLMDTTGGNNSILVPQEFETAPLDDSVFPTGLQDSVELLGWILGLTL